MGWLCKTGGYIMVEIQPISVTDLLERSVSDIDWVAPIDGKLRQGLQVCGGGMGLAVVIGVVGPSLITSWMGGSFFLFFGEWVIGALRLLHSPAMILGNIVALLLFGLLLYQSDGLRATTIPWQRLGVALVGVGALDIAAMALPLAVIALNLVVWAAFIALVVTVVLGVLSGGAS